MAYEIESIDWSKMPEGAVRFSLKDENYKFTWYNEAGEYKISGSSEWYDYDGDGRERYKVKDYIPVNIKQRVSREERLEKALNKLMTKHFYKKSFFWNYVEDTSLQYIDPELYLEITNLLSEIKDK